MISASARGKPLDPVRYPLAANRAVKFHLQLLTLLLTQLIMSLSSIFVPSGVSFESKARVYALICCQTIAVKVKTLVLQ